LRLRPCRRLRSGRCKGQVHRRWSRPIPPATYDGPPPSPRRPRSAAPRSGRSSPASSVITDRYAHGCRTSSTSHCWPSHCPLRFAYSRQQATGDDGVRDARRYREVRREFALAGVSAFVGWAVTGLFLALIPSFVTTVVGDKLVVAGAVVALMLAASTVTALLANRLGSRPVQLAGVGAMAAGVALLLAAAETARLPVLLAATVLSGAGQGLTFMGSLADVNEIAPHDRKANVVAGYYVLVYIATAVPAIGVGALAEPVGLRQAIAIFSVVVLVLCVAGSLALALGRRPATSDEVGLDTGG